MINLDNNFICQHFDKIYNLICHELQKKNLTWDCKASRQDVMISIRRFFYLCRNADKINREFAMIPKWIKDLEIIACMPSQNIIRDTYRYYKLLDSAEPITKFLLYSFDWGITDMNEHYSFLEGFHTRIQYYKERCNFKDTANLLYRMKNKRNEIAHTAINFYTDHYKCISDLVFNLYSYIVIFYMIEKHCKENEKSVSLKKEFCKKINMPDDFLQSHINVELVDPKTKQPVPQDGYKVKLYIKDSINNFSPIGTKVAPYKFEIKFFETYKASVITNNGESNKSEEFTIGHDYAAGTIIRIGIPPTQMKPDPVKISIKELVLGTDNLPGDVYWILERIENYEPKSIYMELAKLLTLGAATNNPEIKAKYQNAVVELKKKLEEEVQINQPKDLNDLLNREMKNFRSLMSLPYSKNKDFKELCKSIDTIHDLIPDSNHDPNEKNIDQIRSNVEKFISGQSFNISTYAIDASKKLQRMLSALKIMLQMKDRYPAVVLAEEKGLYDYINDLCAQNIDTYDPLIFSLRENVMKIFASFENDSNSNDKKSVLTKDYMFLAFALTHDNPENVVRIIQSCSSDLIKLIDKCNNNYKDIGKYKINCIKQIKELRDKSQILVPIIDLDENDIKKAEFYHYDMIKRMQELRFLIEEYSDLNPRNSDYVEYLVFIIQLINNMSANSFVQILCNSRTLKDYIYTCIKNSVININYNSQILGIPDECKTKLNECYQILEDLWNDFNKKTRRRTGDKYYATQNEVNSEKASIVIDDYVWKMIENKYVTKDNIPAYITSIYEAEDFILPKPIKAMMLYIAGSSYSNENESIIYLTKFAMNFLKIIQGDAYFKFLPIIMDKFSEMYLSYEKPSRIFDKLSITAKQDFIHILLNINNIRHIRKSELFITAVQLNNSDGKEIIPSHELFHNTFLVTEKIEGMDYAEFGRYCQAVSLIQEYANRNDGDLYMKACSEFELQSFYDKITQYYTMHINLLSVETTRKIDIPSVKKFLMETISHVSSRTDEEYMLDRYRRLFISDYYYYKYTSAWCELEKQIFDQVFVLIQKKTDKEEKEDLSKRLLDICRFKMPYDDRMACILLTLAPYLPEQSFQDAVKEFYYQIKRKVCVDNTDVYNRLQVISSLFDEHLYNKNYSGIVIGAPINILMVIQSLMDKNLL